MLRAQGDDLEPFDSEIERTFRRRRKEHKQKQQHQMADKQQIHIPIQPIGQMAARVVAPPEQQYERREINEGDLPVSMFLTPIAAPMRSSIVYPDFGVNNFQIRPDWINLMSNTLQFYGLPQENPNTHISRFLRNCQNFHAPGVNEDAIKLRLFPFTLRDAALEWLDAEPHASITTWEELIRKFCNKFFPPARVAKIRLEIQTFQQKEGESYHEAWNRFNELMRKCPNHGITIGNQVQYFYTGLTPLSLSKSQVDASAGGSIIGKSVQQTMELFELIATTHSMFSSERVAPPKTGGMYELDSAAATNAQIVALTKQVELLVKSQTKGAHAVTAGYPDEQVNFIQNGSQNFNPFAQTYNPGWRQHPNFRWSDNQQGNSSNNAQQEKKPSLGEMFNQYMQKTDKVFQQIDTNFQNQQASIKKKETPAVRAPSPVKAYVPPIPFPQRLQRKKLDNQFAKFVEIFKKLHINIPFADAIAQMPSYAKFLKEILSNKRKLEEHEIVSWIRRSKTYNNLVATGRQIDQTTKGNY
ncbi:uncharacterized protein LOC111406443 [Olea europaea var. sylvestris]|uniref:uncharacterized protein LOC111406443 n=1 Tax=Olea europaea var. sylvestris TaxID=158386 RepID=UPI000C1D8CDA|nr:uncharacterized protein LOC111406443 [Olea europaea var. sylvestris]